MIAGVTLYGFSKFPPWDILISFILICDFIANATEEFLVRKRPLYEVVGQLGMWGFIINGVQSSALEWKKMTEVPWNGGISGSIVQSLSICALFVNIKSRYSRSFDGLYNLWGLHLLLWAGKSDTGKIICLLAMLILYTVAPLLYRLASSTFFNLSLLSSDFYGLLFGMYFTLHIRTVMQMNSFIF